MSKLSSPLPLPRPRKVAVVPARGTFSHREACRVADVALGTDSAGGTVVVDLKHSHEATTSAFARLVLLRRLLLSMGRDLRLTNLHDRAKSLYLINRLAGVLPCA